ncbi:uncharacterized protein LOC124932362 [Impatiens glandulifera]|uniref:uncharacterized protein LOC124932362 n=1 Tax=Impatiens glandulifera TaxID=253017 RepID=UPI001FB0B7DC|nr:uncharacterized protein LOC124932362 [Impatiens glandulifera]
MLNRSSSMSLSLLIVLVNLSWMVAGQAPIPAKYDGFLYKNQETTTNTVIIEAFFDPICPDSRDAWPPLKQAFEYYGSRVSLILHPFPLPYHDNSFVTSRALHVVNKVNPVATYDLLELFFKHQEEFYNRPTFNESRSSVVKHVAELATKVADISLKNDIESGFTDWETDSLTRVSFKYGCSRGVYGTPFFFVNGFVLPDGGSAIDYFQWRRILDPVIKGADLKEKKNIIEWSAA